MPRVNLSEKKIQQWEAKLQHILSNCDELQCRLDGYDMHLREVDRLIKINRHSLAKCISESLDAGNRASNAVVLEKHRDEMQRDKLFEVDQFIHLSAQYQLLKNKIDRAVIFFKNFAKQPQKLVEDLHTAIHVAIDIYEKNNLTQQSIAIRTFILELNRRLNFIRYYDAKPKDNLLDCLQNQRLRYAITIGMLWEMMSRDEVIPELNDMMNRLPIGKDDGLPDGSKNGQSVHNLFLNVQQTYAELQDIDNIDEVEKSQFKKLLAQLNPFSFNANVAGLVQALKVEVDKNPDCDIKFYNQVLYYVYTILVSPHPHSKDVHMLRTLAMAADGAPSFCQKMTEWVLGLTSSVSLAYSIAAFNPAVGDSLPLPLINNPYAKTVSLMAVAGSLLAGVGLFRAQNKTSIYSLTTAIVKDADDAMTADILATRRLRK